MIHTPGNAEKIIEQKFKLVPNTSLFRAISQSILVNPNHYLLISVFSSVATQTVIFEGRVLQPNGVITPIGDFPLVTNGLRTSQGLPNGQIPLFEGELLSFTARTTGSGITRGQIFVRVLLMMGDAKLPTTSSIPVQVLISGYVTSATPIGFPFSILENSTDGTGALTFQTSAVTAGNASIGFTTPTNTRRKFHSWKGSVVADGTAANRIFLVSFSNSSGLSIMASISCIAQTAGLTKNYYLSRTYPFTFIPVAGQIFNEPATLDRYQPYNDDFILVAGCVAAQQLSAGVAGDTHQAFVEFEDWLDV